MLAGFPGKGQGSLLGFSWLPFADYLPFSVGWVAQALALRLMHAEPTWDDNAFFDYVDRWMFEDEPRAIATSPRRWHRHVLARPGAYADPRV